MQSPEETGNYRCPTCGNARTFIGYDDHGYPGPEACECKKDLCECQVTLAQPFTVLKEGDIDYQAFTGGGYGAEIGTYSRIHCAVCHTFICPEQQTEQTERKEGHART